MLEGIFERARLSNGTVSTAERVLANVCELRCAIVGDEWLEHLTADGNCLRELAAARFALNEVGAIEFAAYFSEAMVAVRYSYSRTQREKTLHKVAQHLSSAGPVLDVLIATFAQGLLDAESHSKGEDAGISENQIDGDSTRCDCLVSDRAAIAALSRMSR